MVEAFQKKWFQRLEVARGVGGRILRRALPMDRSTEKTLAEALKQATRYRESARLWMISRLLRVLVQGIRRTTGNSCGYKKLPILR